MTVEHRLVEIISGDRTGNAVLVNPSGSINVRPDPLAAVAYGAVGVTTSSQEVMAADDRCGNVIVTNLGDEIAYLGFGAAVTVVGGLAVLPQQTLHLGRCPAQITVIGAGATDLRFFRNSL